MQIKRNSYNLGKSKNIEISSDNLDIKADVILHVNEKELKVHSSISGVVVDVFNNPIKNALVKLMSINLEPIDSTRTDENGKYIISVIPKNTLYMVLATATEKVVKESSSFTLRTGENKIINFTLYNDTNTLFGAISGTLTDKNNNLFKGAVISLYKEKNNSKELVAITYSDEQGTFFFSELLPSKYKILIHSLSSMSYEENIFIESRKIYTFNKSLDFNSNLNDGSISGTITDALGNFISKADVILYKIENNIKTPVAFSQTNNFGVYSFTNVPFGFYLVKSNRAESLELDNIISPSVKITSTLELETYNFSKGILENDAMMDSNGFVTSLGGEKDGSVTLSVNIEKYGLYTLAIYYVSADYNRSLKINVNEKELDKIYKVPITPGWTLKDSKIIEISTPLNAGINIIKFHGDGKSLAPYLNMITLIFNETENIPMFNRTFSFYNDIIFENISLAGTYSNGAKYNKETFLVTALGGENDGSVTLSLEISDLILYYMELKYVAKLPNLTFKIDINEESNNTIYKTPQSKKINILETSTFTLPIYFNKTINSIKFHGDGKNLSPDLDSFYLIVPPITQNLTEGIFENSAKPFKDNEFVSGIGGPQNGAVAVSVDISVYGHYKIYLEYVATTVTLPLKIDVNGINNSTITHFLSPTGGLTTDFKKIFSTLIYFNSGINTLRFYADGKEFAPNLTTFKIIKTTLIGDNTKNINEIKDFYEVTEGKLSGSATLDKNKKFITAIGGENKGEVTFNVTVKDEGEYVLQINYYYLNRNFKISVNSIENEKVCKTLGENRGIFKTTINLKSGDNILKFYGYFSDLAPNLGDFTLRLNAPLDLRKSEFFLYNNAKLLPTGVITSIGGENEGNLALDYFAFEYAEYTLDLILSNDDKELLININNTDIININNTPNVQSSTIAYSKNIVLDYGNNIIKFLGNGKNPAPDIYSLNIKPAFTGSFVYTYSFSKDVLKNSAFLDIKNNFVKNIGTKNNGTALLIVQMENEGIYDLNIQYINPFHRKTPLRLKVNNKFIETTYYIPDTENISDYNKIKIFVIPKISLNKSVNFIEFSGNGIDPVAYLGKVRLSRSLDMVNTASDEYYASEGDIENGAKISSFSKKFIDNLGGNKQEGSVTIKVTIDKEDFYNLFIEYLVNIDNSVLLIEINGDDTGNFYTLPKTEELKEEYSKNFIIPVWLKKGENYIKFHGDKIKAAPSIGKININKAPELTTYAFLNAQLKNAKILDSPVGYISLKGGLNVSSAYIKVKVKKEGKYYLTLRYLSKDKNFLNIAINSPVFGENFNFPATKSENAFHAKSIIFEVYFNSGENLVFFRKLKKANDIEILLHSFSISTHNLVRNFSLKRLFFLNGAKLNEDTGFIEGLGGEENGYIVINTFIAQGGLYDLYINYLSLDVKRKLKIQINDVPIKNSYYFPSTGHLMHKAFVNTVTIPINLKTGDNKIKIYGKNNLLGPMISEITLALNTENAIKFYYLSDGTLKGGATLDNISKTVSNIGEKNNGEVTIKINITNSNMYTLQLQYKSSNNNNLLLLDINNISINKKFKLLETNGYFNNFTIKTFLNTGDNFLRFYGDEKNEGLTLGNFYLINDLNLWTFEKNAINFNVALGELKNGAYVYLDSLDDTPWVDKLGGKSNGSSTVTINIDYDGEYSLIITYFASIDDSKKPISLTISINSKKNGSIYSLIPGEVRKTEFIFDLKKGENKIKFAGDGKNKAPKLSSATLTLKSIYI
ncbi:carboxypeptidase regulatory-like domain-containing protein [Clostridium tarantellae]|uniref:CBM6 domain-containing protein n=1 Tax=Clostridium tarantellae TaxID=39493 RepID=A0A6I1MIL1_9CLOT|nr:carboxypeptidase regulatory-like domain-containing protein [Clostridium tarantellae]MPQ43205.1 hypothetical protein [Clostridium tarantellae]